jgi:hypothetical protein
MCAVACRDMVPDPAFLADCLRSSFADLVCAAENVHAKAAEPAARIKQKSSAREPVVSKRKAGRKAAKGASLAARKRSSSRRKTA